MSKKILLFFFLNAFLPFTNTERTSFFVHGLAATQNQIRLFIKEHKKSDGTVVFNENYIMHAPGISFNFPDSAHALDSSVWFFSLRKLIARLIRGNYDQTSFGQDNEISLMHAMFKEKVCHSAEVIYGGISRGASIFFTWASKHKPTNIVAALLESPYACMADVVNLKRKQFGVEYIISEEFGQAIIEFLFRKYKRSGIRPIDCIKDIDQSIPLLIVASTSDNLVPWESSYRLYTELKVAGHQKVHFLLLNQGQHGFLLTGQDGKKYQQVVHAFYKQYGLPCDEELAQKGKDLFLII